MKLDHTPPPPAVLGAPPAVMMQALLSQALTLVDSSRPGARAWRDQALRLVNQPYSSMPDGFQRGRKPRLAPWQANLVGAFVTENLEDSIRVEDLAGLTRLTPSYFSKAFRGTFGMSPHAYLIERRISRACELMTASDDPLAQIALACGLYDQAHFTRLFRRLHGEAPGSWRRNRRVAPPRLEP